MSAKFNTADHCVKAGFASYQSRKEWWWCRVFGHRWPSSPPNPPNGHSPSNYTRCARWFCDAPGHYFVVGQHRFGGMSVRVSDIQGDTQ